MCCEYKLNILGSCRIEKVNLYIVVIVNYCIIGSLCICLILVGCGVLSSVYVRVDTHVEKIYLPEYLRL